MAHFYILHSEKLNRYYVGACIDLERRLYEHNIGHSKYTSTGVPWKVVYTESYSDLREAKIERTDCQMEKIKNLY
ncbi:GIY-YIG nuclease family protein [Litoribacter populi]|uniref:GIY-YIG nuclease family protein n=1 Tax=Litoribacter populi TaxID=2598460 RepID=UPI001F198235|nr:GIY-YIG nuclease family protein [Litoribacter populi]